MMTTTHTFGQVLAKAAAQLQSAKITSSRLDTLILMEYVTGLTREHILAHPEQQLTDDQAKSFASLIEKRRQRIPIAYLTGYQEFFGRKFKVTPDVLIPRPETEILIESALSLIDTHKITNAIDIGTGSGVIAISLKLERPRLQVSAVDISSDALNVARQNCKTLNCGNINFIESNLLANVHDQFNLIVANLPYVNENWNYLHDYPELKHEPALALYADDDGLDLIKKLISTCHPNLSPNGFLLLEAEHRQIDAIADFAEQCGFSAQKKLPHDDDSCAIILQLI